MYDSTPYSDGSRFKSGNADTAVCWFTGIAAEVATVQEKQSWNKSKRTYIITFKFSRERGRTFIVFSVWFCKVRGPQQWLLQSDRIMEHQSVPAHYFFLHWFLQTTKTISFTPVSYSLLYWWNYQIFNIKVAKSLQKYKCRILACKVKYMGEWIIKLTDSIPSISFLHIPLHLYTSLVATKGISASFDPWILRPEKLNIKDRLA